MDPLIDKLRLAKYTKNLKDKGFTLKKISEITEINLSTLKAIFYQGCSPSSEILLTLAKVLDINPIDMLILAKKLPTKMHEELFERRDVLENLYSNSFTYWTDADKFPDEISQLVDKKEKTILN